ncbi:MinD/ParA family protein [Alkaliphilus serpentinus]|uniref:MinD/ParA family protein n=1 Tax=Alkaliphilus serpentinus TaxID=1482731 RepID=A0A833HPV5_9FIRM|nr:MinD/ParA family protein [Alkaliphilus serpentinus]KAB3531365.1 MinD/ParA family protein [Alkaliphilus serpentinus]
MKDQAARLREMINQRRNNIIEQRKTKGGPRVICVTSGKGGVGKTNFTLNLAIALSKENKKVVIIDADLGLANIDIVMGVVPKYNLMNVINGDKELEDILVNGPNGIKIIAGGSGITDLVDMPSERIGYVIEKFERLNNIADIILVDTGAGLSRSVLSFVLAAEEVIIVATPEPTAITDAYAMIKTIGKSGNKKKLSLLINRVENINEGKIAFEKLKNASEKFLNIKVEKLGFLSEDISVSRAVKSQNPFLLQYPNSPVSKNIELIAMRIIDETHGEGEFHTSGGFFNKVLSLFR